MRRTRRLAGQGAFLSACLIGCGHPVVDPRAPGPVVTSPTTPTTPASSPNLPTADVQPVPTESILQLPVDSQSDVYHTVQAGETLTSISQRYGVSADRLRAANGLDSATNLQPQQLLFIPSGR